MIWSSENSITETDGWVYYDIWNIGKLFFHAGKERSKVDIIDIIMDKFKSMNALSHLIIIISANNHFIKSKIRDMSFIMFRF